jgi:hypothetical protein
MSTSSPAGQSTSCPPRLACPSPTPFRFQFTSRVVRLEIVKKTRGERKGENVTAEGKINDQRKTEIIPLIATGLRNSSQNNTPPFSKMIFSPPAVQTKFFLVPFYA